MANAVIVIPRNGESEIYPSVSAVAREFGLTNQVLNTLIENGSEIKFKGKYYCFDFACDEPVEEPKKKTKYPVKYELTSIKSDRVYKFTSYIDMSKFCGRSLHYTKRILAESKELFTDKSGDVYKLRVIA